MLDTNGEIVDGLSLEAFDRKIGAVNRTVR